MILTTRTSKALRHSSHSGTILLMHVFTRLACSSSHFTRRCHCHCTCDWLVLMQRRCFRAEVVWKASTELGCAQSKCSNLVDKTGAQVFPNFKESVITVCNYSPAGNVIGQFTDNVTKN